MTAPAHTPTPWKTTMVCVSGRGKNSTFRPWIITPDGDRGICEVFVSGNDGRNITTEDRANAAFIVRAVNAHDDLVRTSRDYIDAVVRQYGQSPYMDKWRDALEAAIAKAEGRP